MERVASQKRVSSTELFVETASREHFRISGTRKFYFRIQKFQVLEFTVNLLNTTDIN
jgi:hypothetical protein